MNTLTINTKSSFAGYFRLQVHRAGAEIQDTGWFPNLITNQGLDWFGTAPPNYNVSYGQPLIATHCGVGTGNTAPAFTDTRLTSFLAMFPSTTGSNVENVTTSTYVPGPPAYYSQIKTYSFATGAVVGNVAEVGVGNTAQADTNPQLFNHALILDGSGNPTTISVTSADALTVTYELRQYFDLTDNTYTMTIGATNYSGTYRRAQVNTFGYQNFQTVPYDFNGQYFTSVYNGSIAATTSHPSGTSTTTATGSWAAYNTGTYFVTGTASFSLSQGNLTGGITAIMTTNDTTGSYQFAVSPAIPKTSSYTMTLNYNISWARYP